MIDLFLNQQMTKSIFSILRVSNLSGSNDNRTYAIGDRFLELCKARDLRICNGRIRSDASVGKFTCLTNTL